MELVHRMRNVMLALGLALLFASAVPAADETPTLQAVVSGSEETVRRVAEQLLAAAHELNDAGPSLDGLVLTQDVAQGAKLMGQLVVTDGPVEALRIEGCAVFTTGKAITGAYITDSLVVAATDVVTGSYLTNSVVLAGQQVAVGSYANHNVIDAGRVAVGSRSSGNVYLKVKPHVGSRSNGDRVLPGDTRLRSILRLMP